MTEKKKQRRDRRAKHPPPMELTPRDQDIVRAVYQYRVLKQEQLQRLFFGTSAAAQRVLARLYHHGYLERVFLPVFAGRSPTFYVLDKKGTALLHTEFGYDELSWYPTSKTFKGEFLAHSSAISDVRITVTLAARKLGFSLVTWMGENEMKSDYDKVKVRTSGGRTQLIPIIPDSYFVLDTPLGRTHFFLELDRGTMTMPRFKTKVEGYIIYHQSGGYEARFGTKSLRILTVTSGQKRLQNLKAVTEDAGGKNRFWFATKATLAPQNIFSEPLWFVAGNSDPMALIRQEEKDTV
ncbi:MAG: replication-relaxation family protein [Aggregatilineales bacterium]